MIVLTIRRVDIGTQIRKARTRAGLSQEQLAFKCGLSRNYISLVELNRKSPTLSTLARICHSMGVRVSALVAAAEIK